MWPNVGDKIAILDGFGNFLGFGIVFGHGDDDLLFTIKTVHFTPGRIRYWIKNWRQHIKHCDHPSYNWETVVDNHDDGDSFGLTVSKNFNSI